MQPRILHVLLDTVTHDLVNRIAAYNCEFQDCMEPPIVVDCSFEAFVCPDGERVTLAMASSLVHAANADACYEER